MASWVRILIVSSVCGCIAGGAIFLGGRTVSDMTISATAVGYILLNLGMSKNIREANPYPKTREPRRH